ncbi:uncharacterized protein LOC111873065 isoform X3 [Cryptotermes secundus]|uniref:uncharacterized protein LOC111873065 isoform X3 n=1 Tax=Cryptotermes secundus TaxID=105785 RepID=UPI001454DED3|nr:uncharacterized protein LOC111873065 isoform X3 [Cryptotermes secundus]
MLRYAHLSHLILGLLLLATSLAHVQGAATPIFTRGGLQLFQSRTRATDCQLILPDGTNCTYQPGTTPAPPHKECSFPNDMGMRNYCLFQVSVTSKHLSGIYSLSYTNSSGDFQEDIYNLYLLGGGVPISALRVIENENIYLRIEYSVPGTMNCDVIYPNGTTEELISSSSQSSPNHWGRKDECGVKIDGVSQQHSGLWKLLISSDEAYIYDEFSVYVTPLSSINTRPRPPIEWPFGGPGSVSMSHANSKYCELWNPRKELVQHTLSGCNYVQSIVTDADNGNWTFVFGVNGKFSEESFTQEIKVIKELFKVNATESERFPGGLDLLCSVSPGEISDCRFTRPDGKVFLSAEGLGNADYSYFGDGFRNGDCGLTIHQLKEADKGWWNCLVKTGAKTKSGFLNVLATEVSDPDEGNHEALVTLQKGSDVYLSCSAHNALEYCWFQHPSGYHFKFSTETVLSGLQENTQPRSYKYDDTLHLGICAIRVGDADVNVDSGEWTCHLGVPGSPEEDHSVPITVRVSESGVISLDKEVVFSNGFAVLKCYSVPIGKPLQYCRFLRPDGNGFNVVPGNNVVLGRYQYEAEGLEKGECGLRIHSESATAEDIGKWTCVAKLQGKAQEEQDFITLRRIVSDPDEGNHEALVTLQKGSDVYLSCRAHSALEYCWFRHPSGYHFKFSTETVLSGLQENTQPRSYKYDDTLHLGICAIRVGDADVNVDSGEWTCHLGVPGSPEEDHSVPITVGVSESGVISLDKEVVFSNGFAVLKCYSVPIGKPLQYCRFLRPDGKGFNVVPGNNSVVLGRYQYEAEGLEKGECGLRIHSESATAEDIGKWTCVAKLQGKAQEEQDFITLRRIVSDPDEGNHEALVTLQKGSDVYLSCSAHTALEYCWFRHPSGYHFRFSTETVLSGLLENTQPRSYNYYDTLHLGICAIRVAGADVNVDSGEWTCHLGVPGSPEEDHSVPITVGVSESGVISLDKEVVFSNGFAVLKCYSVPIGKPLQYCRFLRPDGKGFNVVPGNNTVVLGRYQYEAEGLEKGECGLRIHSESATAEDVGNWTCVARLQGMAQEGEDFITLKRIVEQQQDEGLSTGAIVGIATGGAVAILLIAGLTFYFVRRKSA